jgi:hypothetical protein
MVKILCDRPCLTKPACRLGQPASQKPPEQLFGPMDSAFLFPLPLFWTAMMPEGHGFSRAETFPGDERLNRLLKKRFYGRGFNPDMKETNTSDL